MIKNRKSVLFTLLTIVLFILMFGEVLTYAIININFSQVAQQSSLMLNSKSFAQTLSAGMQNFLQSSLTGALSAYYSSQCSGNFTLTVKNFIVNGNAGPSCTGSSTALAHSTLSQYVASLEAQARQQQVNLIIINPTFNVYQNSPLNVSASYTAYAKVNSSYGTFTVPLFVNAIAQIQPSQEFVPITLVNSQTTASSPNTQVMISFSPLQYQVYERQDLGNIRFYYNNTELYSWCESNCQSTSSTNATFWVKVPVAIPAQGSITIDMYILQKGVEYDGVYAGEAPQLSPTYAEYDNGANVFGYYANFAGTNLPSGWTYLYGSAASINNEATLTATTDIYYSTSTYNPQNYILEAYVQSAPSADWGGIIYTTTTTSGGNYGLYTGYAAGESTVQQIYTANAGNEVYINGASINYPAIFGIYWGATGSANEYTNYASPLTASTTDEPTITNSYIGLGAWGGGAINFNWVRLRTYPPNGVMPSEKIGQLSLV